MFAAVLPPVGHHLICALSPRAGIVIAKRLQPDVVFVDLKGPDGDGLRVVRSIRQYSPYTVVVTITHFGTTRSAVRAMQLGAAEYFEKPLDMDNVLRFVDNVRPRAHAPVSHERTEPYRHAVSRWVDIVLRTIDVDADPHTVAHWARAVATSAGTIRSWCRAAHLEVKPSLNFSRMLRVVMRCDGCTPIGDLLNIVDTRTLVGFLKLGDASARPCQLPMDVDEFFRRQRWIADPFVQRKVRLALDRSGPSMASGIAR
jgi:ActR/RegA family two-component response regulator